MHKHINTNKYLMWVQWKNQSCTGNINKKLHKEKQTQGEYCVKCKNI